MPCLFCDNGCELCEPVEPDTGWVGCGATPTQKRNAARGLHPMGFKLHPDAEQMHNPLDWPGRCGNCVHHWVRVQSKRYHKCELVRATAGPGSDTRVRWPACIHWAPGDGWVMDDRGLRPAPETDET